MTRYPYVTNAPQVISVLLQLWDPGNPNLRPTMSGSLDLICKWDSSLPLCLSPKGQRTSETRVGQVLSIIHSAPHSPPILQGRLRSPKRAHSPRRFIDSSAEMSRLGPVSFATRPLSQRGSLTEKPSKHSLVQKNWRGRSLPLAPTL